jgi:hypothetical protein
MVANNSCAHEALAHTRHSTRGRGGGSWHGPRCAGSPKQSHRDDTDLTADHLHLPRGRVIAQYVPRYGVVPRVSAAAIRGCADMPRLLLPCLRQRLGAASGAAASVTERGLRRCCRGECLSSGHRRTRQACRLSRSRERERLKLQAIILSAHAHASPFAFFRLPPVNVPVTLSCIALEV